MGTEGLAVGATMAMKADEYILPLHHHLGVFTTRDIPVSRLLGQLFGKASGFTRGRSGLFNFGSHDHKIVGATSHQGTQLSVAAGIALADVLSDKNKATLVFASEYNTSNGDFHEALNLAAVWNLPIIFLIENNSAALSTPNHDHYRCERLADKALGYGIEGRQVDGNNLLEVYNTVNEIAAEIRQNPRPVLLEAITFKMPLDDEDQRKVTQQMLDLWQEKGPVRNFEKYLLTEILSLEWVSYLKSEFAIKIEEEVKLALNESALVADAKKELASVYKEYVPPLFTYAGPLKIKSYAEGIMDGLSLSLDKHSNLIVLGSDIYNNDRFKITAGLVEKYGKLRVKNTPDCESGVIGTAMGLAINGYKAIVEAPFADVMSSGFNHVVNTLAKTYYRWEQNADVVVRIPVGGNAACYPSQASEAWFAKTPGLKVVYPAFPADAKGLLMSAIDDPNPVIYFEHKHLYRNLTGEVPDGTLFTEIGKARVVKEGAWASIITYGMGVHWALEYARKHPEYSIEIIDLRTLQPWDKVTVEKSIAKTSRALILHEDSLTGGFGAEIAAHIAQHCFTKLDAPVMRCASLDTPVPMDKGLHELFLANARLDDIMEKLLRF
jgi:2-oxoisovalerate dehydrogenase E1 component